MDLNNFIRCFDSKSYEKFSFFCIFYDCVLSELRRICVLLLLYLTVILYIEKNCNSFFSFIIIKLFY